MSDSIDVLELMVERLTAEVKALRFEESALRRDAAELTAENARLRAEVEIAVGARNLNGQQVLARGVEIGKLTDALARVTGERDRLLEAVDHYFDAYFHGIYDREKADAELLAVRASCSSSTEEQIAACAPPASGEDG